VYERTVVSQFISHFYGGRSQLPRGLRRVFAVLARWDCKFESRMGHRCLSLVSVVYFQVEISATGRSFVKRSPAECGLSERDLETSQWGGLGPLGLSSHKKF